MSGTRPTGDQLLFRSGLTGDHSVDSYLEAAEQGGRTLAAKLQDLFTTDTGSLRQGLVQLRLNSSTQELETRFGNFVDDSGWTGIGAYIARFRGDWADATQYEPGDYVVNGGITYITIEAHLLSLIHISEPTRPY